MPLWILGHLSAGKRYSFFRWAAYVSYVGITFYFFIFM